MTDRDLLQKYSESGDLEAFSVLVARHVNMVHGAARRQAPQAADDVVQAVFLLLAQKAAKISRQASISGWLYRTVGYCCANVQKMENRRRHYELEAAKMTQSAEDASWEKLLPVLDQALNALGPTERDAVLLHYLEAKSLEEMARELGTTADTAAKRASRGVQKLRRYFINQGYAIPATAVDGLMAREAAKAAPAALVKSAQSALAAGTPAASATVASLMKGTEAMMTVAKIKSVAVVMAACLLVSGSVAGVAAVAWSVSTANSLSPAAHAAPAAPILADVAPPAVEPPTTAPFSQATPTDTLRKLCGAMEANDKATIFECLCDDGKDSFTADLARSFVRSGASAYHLENVWKEKFGTTMKVSGLSFEAFPTGTYVALFKDTMNTPGGPEVTIEDGVAKMRVSDPPEAFAGTGPDRAPDRGRWSGAMLIFTLVDGDWKLNTYRTFNIGLSVDRIDGNRTDIMEIGSKFGNRLCDALDAVAAQIGDGTIKTQAQAVTAVRTRVQRAFRDVGVDNAGLRVLPVIAG